jgi:hypothetical protein
VTLSEIITRLQDTYGNTISSSDTYYTRIINDSYAKLCGLSEWWWLEKDYVITANQPVETFTGTATVGSTTITASSAISTVYGARAWVEAPERVFRVESASAGTYFTIDSKWIETTATDVSFSIWGDTYVLPTDFDSAITISCRADPNHKPLRQVDLEDIEAFGPFISDKASEFADRFAIYPNPDSTATSKTFVARLFPPQDETSEYLLRYRMCPATLSAAAEVPFLPEKFHFVLVDMARLQLYKNEGEDADRIQMAESDVSNGVAMLMRQNTIRGRVQYRFARRGYGGTNFPQEFKFINTNGVDW